ncbi:hypothetical protein HK097_008395 [Rhizophlyctis rosea]|uniref:Uncharacterized protein n=1 Tax=Rhizophlyctis rosea TaxID=64517 RepID=A0AAD5SD04_9FUNG|nr:hypothetical protein HK097_008395 [Rhizophlyctis rosea]
MPTTVVTLSAWPDGTAVFTPGDPLPQKVSIMHPPMFWNVYGILAMHFTANTLPLLESYGYHPTRFLHRRRSFESADSPDGSSTEMSEISETRNTREYRRVMASLSTATASERFKTVMGNPTIFARYKSFAARDLTTENPLFWEHYTSLIKLLPNPPSNPTNFASAEPVPPVLIPLFLKIYTTFILPDSPLELNLPGSVTQMVFGQMEPVRRKRPGVGVRRDVFVKVAKCVEDMIYETLPRFLEVEKEEYARTGGIGIDYEAQTRDGLRRREKTHVRDENEFGLGKNDGHKGWVVKSEEASDTWEERRQYPSEHGRDFRGDGGKFSGGRPGWEEVHNYGGATREQQPGYSPQPYSENRVRGHGYSEGQSPGRHHYGDRSRAAVDDNQAGKRERGYKEQSMREPHGRVEYRRDPRTDGDYDDYDGWEPTYDPAAGSQTHYDGGRRHHDAGYYGDVARERAPGYSDEPAINPNASGQLRREPSFHRDRAGQRAYGEDLGMKEFRTGY